MDYHGRRATVMGLGHFGGGLAAARWLAQQGAQVTVTDSASPDTLADVLPQLADVPLASLRLGGHCEEDFRDAALIVVNPAVQPDSPWLHFARSTGAKLCTELELFIENCPAKIVGVTGSNGKSTTTAMIAAALRAAGRNVFLGGNLGGSLLDDLPKIAANDWVVLEISSFQLWHFSSQARMPHISVITNCTPNHLNWHGPFSDYAAAKQRMLRGQTSQDFAVLNPYDPETAQWHTLAVGQLVALPPLDTLPQLKTPGLHNRYNAACAAAAAIAAGCRTEDIRRGLEHFVALPQRMELVTEIDGRRFYNDSTATTPESTIAALQSLDSPVWLLAGGKSKGFDLGPLSQNIAKTARGAGFFGSLREELFLRVTTIRPTMDCVAIEHMADALAWCWQRSQPGDTIVLSPGCASTDQFRNFRERGEQFVACVARLKS